MPSGAALAGGSLLGAGESGRAGSAGSLDAASSGPGSQAGERCGSPVRAGGDSLLGGLEDTLGVGGGTPGPPDPFAAVGGGEGPERPARPGVALFGAPGTGSGGRSEAARLQDVSLAAVTGGASGAAAAVGRATGDEAAEQQGDLLGGFPGTLGAPTQASTPPLSEAAILGMRLSLLKACSEHLLLDSLCSLEKRVKTDILMLWP